MPAPRQIPILRARILDGCVIWQGLDEKRWKAAKIHLNGQDVDISIQKHRKKRSLNQNSFYWGVVLPIIAEAGGFLTVEEAHDAMRLHFLQKHDGPLPTVRSTTDLSTAEFEEYLSKIRILAAEMWGAYVPEPHEVEMTA